MVIAYLRWRTHFHAKATVSGVASKMRCLGEYLVEQGIWRQNPMRWVKGPAGCTGQAAAADWRRTFEKLWEATGQQRSKYQQHLGVAMLSLLYGTGLRRGELERMNLADWRREESLLRIDGARRAVNGACP